ncbi:MAG: VCBS repeat-containing protein, partial [Acidimicrobiia bacterium]|nr:VCBS repeat-containing protein [Acidimicrobiia bacterium]
ESIASGGRFSECAVRTWTVAGVPPGAGFMFGDFDGTSRSDFWVIDTSGSTLAMSVYLHRDDFETAVPVTTSIPVVPDASYLLLDADVDGVVDLASLVDVDGTLTLEIWDGASGFTVRDVAVVVSDATTPGWRAAAGDYDVDGVPDVYVFGLTAPDAVHVLDGAGGFDEVSATWTSPGVSAAATVGLGEYDGDGRPDLYLVSEDARVVVRAGGSSTNLLPPTWITPQDYRCENPSPAFPYWHADVSGDPDGDGRSEAISYSSFDGMWWVWQFEEGSAPVGEVWQPGFSRMEGWLAEVGDFDGDGRSDVALFHPLDGRWWVLRSDGSRFVTEVWQPGFSRMEGWLAEVGDFDGDGRSDVALFHPL